jgi:predicted RNA binding protein YcfA (HicA-like mRNA interferase family)
MCNRNSTFDFIVDVVQECMRDLRRELRQELDNQFFLKLAEAIAPPPASALQPDPLPAVTTPVPAAATRPRRSNRTRNMTAAEMKRSLGRLGFVRRKSGGGHAVFDHPKHGGHVTVADHTGDIPRPTLTSILDQIQQVLGTKFAVDARSGRLAPCTEELGRCRPVCVSH